MKSSDDGGPGVYTLVTDPQLKNHDKMIFGRSEMVAGFGDTAYSLKVGEVGMCPYDPAKSKFGWHVIKRIE